MKAEDFLTQRQEDNIVQAIVKAEKMTRGEIRVHIEEKPCKEAVERAKEVFNALKMYETKDKTGVLFYVNVGENKIAIVGDQGINQKVGEDFWMEVKDLVVERFKQGLYEKGIIQGIEKTAEKLSQFFPIEGEDKDELPNNITKERDLQ